jgi:signal recognition particle receptor subunit beta
MNEMNVAILGGEEGAKNQLIKNLTDSVNNPDISVDKGFAVANGKHVHLFTNSGHDEKRLFQEMTSEKFDLGIVLVDSSVGVSKRDRQFIEEVKNHDTPCIVFFNDAKEEGFHSFGKNIIHGRADSSVFANRLLDFLTRMS